MKRLSVSDRLFGAADRNVYFAPTQIGRTQSLTPEGYLLCRGVAIARTGELRYHESELPVDPDPAGMITITRSPEEVFSPTTIASFEGKPVTIEHPDEFVNPSNWREHEVGTVSNVRRGEGIEDDMLIADLLVKDADAIEHVRRDRPEVSCGYESEYEQTAPGYAVQRSIVGNHVALVDRGRAGPRCAIRDRAAFPFADPEPFPFPKTKDLFMKKQSRDFLLTANSRLTAEPNPPLPAGGLGVRLTGSVGAAPEQVDTDAIADAITAGLGLLSAADLTAVKEKIARYGGGGRTNSAGITSSDGIRDALAAVAEVRRATSEVAVINQANAKFWAERQSAEDHRMSRR